MTTTPISVTSQSGETIAKRMMWLAWQGVGGPIGMGVFQDNPSANEDAVWNNASGTGDYIGSRSTRSEGSTIYADYVFGRMMKLHIGWDNDNVITPDRDLALDYQAWGVVYPTYDDLVTAAIESFEKGTNK